MNKFLPILVLSLFSWVMSGQTYSGKITAVKDGDTVVMLIKNKPQTIRLAHIDTPEKKQPYGTKAKQFVSDFCFGKTVKIVIANKPDRNGRWIAELYHGNRNLNKELVRSGLAWHYKQFSKNDNYAALELNARRKKVGLWQDKTPVAPWEWRKMKKARTVKASN